MEADSMKKPEIKFTKKIRVSRREGALAIVIVLVLGGGSIAWLWSETQKLPEIAQTEFAAQSAEEALGGIEKIFKEKRKQGKREAPGTYRFAFDYENNRLSLERGKNININFDDGITPEEKWYELIEDKKGRRTHASGSEIDPEKLTGYFRTIALSYPDAHTLRAEITVLWLKKNQTHHVKRTQNFIEIDSPPKITMHSFPFS